MWMRLTSLGVVWKILMVHSLVVFFRVVVFVDGVGGGMRLRSFLDGAGYVR